ncbi:hypothetical protein EVAR_99940_1 [Eumeta japonica]|uniref:Uncharacterized protein n=1 Tax=Eumeta variegata TaxID=151549 RepID=A0A4C1T4U7_EUMVA|nr:hypothetical protein EVAR_99940_1 [Eumeta japonica]
MIFECYVFTRHRIDRIKFDDVNLYTDFEQISSNQLELFGRRFRSAGRSCPRRRPRRVPARAVYGVRFTCLVLTVTCLKKGKRNFPNMFIITPNTNERRGSGRNVVLSAQQSQKSRYLYNFSLSYITSTSYIAVAASDEPRLPSRQLQQNTSWSSVNIVLVEKQKSFTRPYYDIVSLADLDQLSTLSLLSRLKRQIMQLLSISLITKPETATGGRAGKRRGLVT